MLYTLLQSLATILTLESAVFLTKGSLALTPQSIAGLSSTYFGFNRHLIRSLSNQKADTGMGSILLLLAFLLQMVTLWRGPTYGDLGSADRTGLTMGFVIGVLILLMALWTSSMYSSRLVKRVEDVLKTIQANPTQSKDKERGPDPE